MNEDTR